MEMLSIADDSSGANPSSVKSDDSSPRHESGRGSPPPKCAICLGTCRNKSFTDSCLHQFCFKCLLTWSKVKAECPLCKQIFKSIIHNVRSNHQYDEYTVEQRQEETEQSIDIDSLTNATRRFRYRTTLTLPRSETIAIQQLLMQHYPLMADVFPPPAPRAPTARRRRSPTTFRRTVYRHNLWARPLPDFTGRFRDCTPEFYRYNDSQMHRLVPWLNRELSYLLNDNIGHIQYVMARILDLLPRYHINSPEFREAMTRYFGERTEHFLHELYCFASTPYDMTGYDRNVQYTTDSRISTMVNEVFSSSDSEASVDSDIVMVSSSHGAEGGAAPLLLSAGPSRPPAPPHPPAPQYPHHYIPQPAASAANNVIPIETISHSDTDDDDEVMVVGYIKPPQDRTPEVVDLLGSDSDVIVQDTTQPEPSQSTEPAETRPAGPLTVKLSLKKRRSRENRGSDSDSSYYGVSAVGPARRARSNGTATTSDTTRTTPSPARAPSPAYTPSVSVSASPSPSSRSPSPSSGSPSSHDFSIDSPFTDSSTTSYSSYEKKKRLTKRKSKRKTRQKSGVAEPPKKKRKRMPRSQHRERSSTKPEPQEGKTKRKSHSGKGVKSSRKCSAVAAGRPEPSQTPPLPARCPAPAEQPSTSAVASQPAPAPANSRARNPRTKHTHETRRLKSVVNVMYKSSGDSSPAISTASSNTLSSSVVNQPNGEERTKTENCTPPRVSEETYPNDVLQPFGKYSDEDTDSDDLPLNLSVQKTYTNL